MQANAVPSEAERGNLILCERYTDSCEPPRGCRELNWGSLQEQQVLLTPAPSLQPSQAQLLSGVETGSQVLAVYGLSRVPSLHSTVSDAHMYDEVHLCTLQLPWACLGG